MRLSEIVLKLRTAATDRFGDRIGGAAQFALAKTNTTESNCAYVIPIGSTASPNQMDMGLDQFIKEVFAVVVVIANDYTDQDNVGFLAMDALHDTRTQIFSAILNWQPTFAQSVISYQGSHLFDITRAYLWYQYTFEVDTRITGDDGYDNDFDDLNDFNTIYAQYILAPDTDNLPIEGPPNQLTRDSITGGINVTGLDMEQQVDEDS